MRAAEQALAARHSQGLDRIQSMGVLPSLASVPELQERRHSLPAGADSTMRSGPPPQQRPEQQRSRPDDSAAAGAPFCCVEFTTFTRLPRTSSLSQAAIHAVLCLCLAFAIELQEVGRELRHVCASDDQSKVIRKASQVMHSYAVIALQTLTA